MDKITNQNKKNIVIIEDDPELQKSLFAALSVDFNVFQAHEGEGGLRAVFDLKPDLIVLDLILPKKSGFEVLEEIKGKQEFKEIPVIVLSNLEGRAEINRVMALGAKAYLIKAYYDLAEVVKIIKKEFDK
ncbi:MAG: hypothetical protein A3H02_01480 [Candidatus Niyogibacteria bacterium RIFCSPLOWO2_12_FULL_41_13]|uniref:Response regulatory domain-containing protein n=1 Tax=Candidatus Niyogibacteria bacterium RIFCSPLOWO2_12_FULL_41_13 TaxID=1801726 RepID=A0A1G2F1A7_9BACT|nr:MAG: hypothetical protein A3H02_01480 [Candidatus Niyogibacteria bacterium RIFCSPLOWO2_12_FULL_41_13]